AKCARFAAAVPPETPDWPACCDATALGGGPGASAATTTCGIAWFGTDRPAAWRRADTRRAARHGFRRLNRSWRLFARDQFLDRAGGNYIDLARVGAIFSRFVRGGGYFVRFVARCDDRRGRRENRAP